jgi:hypothetical protein
VSELLTIAQVAALLQVSPDTVMRRFARVKGVLDIGTPGTPKKRRYRVLRIPKSVVERWSIEHGGRITVDIPTPKAKCVKSEGKERTGLSISNKRMMHSTRESRIGIVRRSSDGSYHGRNVIHDQELPIAVTGEAFLFHNKGSGT